MTIVDAHCHVSEGWYEPVEVLLAQMERHGVGHAVLVQMQGQFANGYQFDCVRRYPGRFAPVVLIDTSLKEAPAELERLADAGASGVRLSATTRSPGDDPIQIWRVSERLGLPVSCAGTAAEFAAPGFAALVAALPGLTIVLEHLGSVNQPDRDAQVRTDRLSSFDLARFPNVFMKIPGLGEFCQRASPVSEAHPFMQPEPPLLEAAFAAFGARRLMWGSDYPPVSAREGYGNALNLPMSRFAAMTGVTQDDIAQVYGKTALSVFPVRG